MNPRMIRRIAVPGVLAIPLVASLALGQRNAVPARTPPQNPDLKLPAPPPPVQPPMVRDTQGRTQTAPAVPKIPEFDTNQTSYRTKHDQLYLSNQADGSPQVRARTYKAEFTPAGATYVPFCGSAASMNHPVSFRIESIESGGEPLAFANDVLAGNAGQTVSYTRNSVTELYELGLDSLEQKFVFQSLPSSGELVVRLSVATEMPVAWEGNVIVYTSVDGGVRYGAATVIDANGASAPAPTEIVAGGIEIRVPAEFVATAAFPLTIDPVVSTFVVPGILTEPVNSFAPSIAWDETNTRYCVVFEEEFSASDHDTVRAFVSPTGVVQSSGYVDTSLTAYWADPDVANNNQFNQFFVVAEVGLPTSGTRTIHGRTLDASTATLGADVDVSAGGFGEHINPSVGGDPFGGGSTYYTVVWQRIFSVGVDDDVHCRQVDNTGALVGTGVILIDNSGGTLDRNPRISTSCEGPGSHHVVWERWVSGSDRDVYGAQVNFLGTVTIPSTAMVTSGDTTAPACSPIDNAGNWLLVYEYDFGDHDIIGAHVTGVTINDTLNLSIREDQLGTGNFLQDQRSPAAETDGNHFAYSYSEQYSVSTTDYDIYVSSVDYIGGNLMVGEFFQNLAFSTTHEDFPHMCSQQGAGGSTNRMGIVWSDTGGTNLGNIEGGLYNTSDYTKLCFAFVDGVMGCPCANGPSGLGLGCDNSSGTGGASLNGTGNASLALDTAVLSTFGEKPTATSVVAQGPGLIGAGTTFGQGIRCAGASGGIGLKRLYTKTAVGGAITAPTGGDPSIHVRSAALGDPLAPGNVRFYYVYYRDPTVLGGCSALSTFNSTDTLQILWRP